MKFQLERTGYLRASLAAFAGTALGIGLFALARRYAWSPWSMVAFASIPLWGATACWAALRWAHVRGYVSTAVVTFAVTGIAAFDARSLMAALPLAMVGAALGRFLCSFSSSSESGRQRDTRRGKIGAVLVLALLVGAQTWLLVSMQQMIIGSWSADRASILEPSPNATCAEDVDSECAQEAANTSTQEVAWLPEVPGKLFVELVAIAPTAEREGVAIQTFIAPDGPARSVELTTNLPPLFENGGQLSEVTDDDGITYRLSANDYAVIGAWDSATLTWQREGTEYALTLGSGFFGGAIEPESLWTLVESIRYTAPKLDESNSPAKSA